MRDIGKNIRSLRQRQGISQDHLAQILHVTRQTVSNYETGRSRPDVEMLTALADALGADVTDVLYGPVGQEPRTKQLRHLAIVAGITALLGIGYWRGALWARDLMRSFYHMGPSIVLRILIQPLLCGLLTWVIIRTCMIATRARRPQALWATWIRWGAVVVAVFLSPVYAASVYPADPVDPGLSGAFGQPDHRPKLFLHLWSPCLLVHNPHHPSPLDRHCVRGNLGGAGISRPPCPHTVRGRYTAAGSAGPPVTPRNLPAGLMEETCGQCHFLQKNRKN